MGKGKRRKSKGNNPSELARRLETAWNGDSAESVDSVFDLAMETPRPSDIFESVAAALPVDERVDFASELFAVAGTLYPGLMDGGGRLIDASFCLFTVAVHGLADDIARMSADPAFAEFVRQPREAGLVHEDATVVVCPIPFDPPSAADLSPEHVRSLAVALLRGAMDLDYDVASDVRGLLLDRGAGHPGGVQVVTRLFVGARLLPYVDNRISDLFDPPDFCGDDTDAAAFAEHAAALGDARKRFAAATRDVLAARGLTVIVDGPGDWTEGLGAMAMLRLLGGLDVDARMSGLNGVGRADEAHIVATVDTLHVALMVGGTLIGPIDVPMTLCMYGMEEVTDWMATCAKTVIHHPDLASLMALHGPTLH